MNEFSPKEIALQNGIEEKIKKTIVRRVNQK